MGLCWYSRYTACECGTSEQTMQHLLRCPLLENECSLEDLATANEKALHCARAWPNIWLNSEMMDTKEEPGQFTLISMGLIRYSCGHILGRHEPIPTKFGVWRFFIMLYRNMRGKKIMKMLIKYFWWRHHFGRLIYGFSAHFQNVHARITFFRFAFIWAKIRLSNQERAESRS